MVTRAEIWPLQLARLDLPPCCGACLLFIVGAVTWSDAKGGLRRRAKPSFPSAIRSALPPSAIGGER